ncbi:MAG: hypothetical protein AAGD13_16160 [Pseudomonadota bacterium]
MGNTIEGWTWSVYYSSKNNVPWAIIAKGGDLGQIAAVVLLLDPLDSNRDGKVGSLEWLFGDAKKGQYKQMRATLKHAGNMLDSQLASKHVFTKTPAGGLHRFRNENPNFNFATLLSDADAKALTKVNSELATVASDTFWCRQQDKAKMNGFVHSSSMSNSKAKDPVPAVPQSDNRSMQELLKERNAMIQAAAS